MLEKTIAYFRASGAVARVYVASLFFLGFAAFSNSVIAGEEVRPMMGFGLLLVFAQVIWLVHLLCWVFYLRRKMPVTIKDPWRYWTFGPLMTALAFVVIWIGGFRWVRFVISEPFLRREAVAQLSATGPDYLDLKKFVGLHYVRRIYRFEGGCVWLLTTRGNGGIADGGGFVYSADGLEPPQGKGPTPGVNDYSHLFGPWWRWEADF